MDAPITPLPKHFLSQPYTVAAYECLTGLHASLPAITNQLQEIAGCHADALGVGIQTLQAEGFTWMLGRLALRIYRLPEWKETTQLETWPSGVRGRLMAERQFRLRAPSGEVLLEASSEWLYVDRNAQRIVRQPEKVLALAYPDTLNFGLCGEKFPALPTSAPLAEQTFTVRRSEIDTNLHVNNVHYTTWMLETLPEDIYFRQMPKAWDIEYKQAARFGDTVVARTYALAPGTYLHTVTRPDGTLLARAKSHL